MEAKHRWAVLLLLLVATVAAIAYPVEEESNEGVISSVASPSQLSQSEKEKSVGLNVVWVASDEDPFAPRTWQGPTQTPTVEQTKSVPAVAEISPPPPVPQLPYKFVGQMNDEGGRTVYLARGDQVMLVRQGDVLEGSYKVTTIRASQIEFEALSSGLKQTLAIPLQEN